MGGNGDNILQAALDLAARGFRVFPLVPHTKSPAFKGWKDRATTDPELIRQMWADDDMVIGFTKDGREVTANPRFNVGVACGGGLLVVDADVKDGKDGINSARALGVGFSGFVVRTPSGGLHEYLDGPDVANSAGDDDRFGSGVDIRSAGGFVVGPGSILDQGPYTLETDAGIAPAPANLVQRCIAPAERRNTSAPVVTVDRPDSVDRSLAYLVGAPLATEGDAGDTTTFKVAATLKDYGLSEDMAADLMAEHWNDRCSPPWPIDDLKIKVRNAYEYGARPVGDLHPMADFAGVKPPQPDPRPGRGWFRHGDARGKVDWLYYQLLPKTGVGVMVAPTGSGKTFLSIELARSLATGKAFFNEAPDDRGATLFLFAGTEGSGLGLRLEALGETERLPISATLVGNLAAHDALPNLLADIQAESRWLLAEYGVPVRLIVLETLAASGLLADENDNSAASLAMANLAQISHATGAFVMTSHHPPKDGKGARGASAIPSAADYVIEIGREGQIRQVELVKARDAEARQIGSFTLLPVELGKDEKGRPITSMTISTGAVMSNAVRAAPHADKLVEVLEWAAMENGEDVGGRVGCEESLVRDMFRERKGGSGDRSNVLKAYKAAKAWLQQIGRLDIVPLGTETFLVLREPVAAP